MTSPCLRVVVVGINYAPEHAGIAPYTTQFCEHLVREGHEVLVLAGLPSYPSWSVEPEYRGKRVVEESINGVTVRRLWHYVPPNQSGLRRAVYEASFGAHVSAQKLPWTPDVVVAVVPSLLGASAAAGLARRHGARLAVWVQDLMGAAAAQSGMAGGGRFAKIAARSERKLLREADHVFAINESFAHHVQELGVAPTSVSVVRNWTHILEPQRARATVRRKLGWENGETVVLHSGNMGYKQALENVVAAAMVAETRRSRVRFVLMGDGSQRPLLELLGRDANRLEILDPVDAADYADTLAAADVLLVNERPSVVGMSLPSKLTSYFRAGRPVVAAVNERSATALEIGASGAGRLVKADDPERLLAAVENVVADPDEMLRLTTAGTKYVAEVLDRESALRRLTTRIAGLADVSSEAFDRELAALTVAEAVSV